MKHLLTSILAAVTLVACAGSGSRQVVAVVNGDKITAADVAALLPRNLDSTRADTVKKQVLDGLITRKLFAQEARREGMEKDVAYEVELEQKALVGQRLYDRITAAGNRAVTEAELQAAYKLLQTEAHIKLISVPDESTAARLAAELDGGAVFESLAVKYSKDRAAVKGGDRGFLPLLFLDAPLRNGLKTLTPGERTRPTEISGAWQIAMLVETRPASPPPLDSMRQQFETRLKQMRRRELANEYLAKLRDRVSYNAVGLDILCKPIDSITEAEKDVAVAYKDKSKYVKVARLLPVAARFPVALDSATKKYAVRRAIEEDLMYEDGLRMGLEKAPDIARQLASRTDEVLYNALMKKEITDKVVVTDSEAMDHFRQHRQNYTSPDSTQVAGSIRSYLLTQKRNARMKEYVAELTAKAKIEINQAALAAVNKEAAAEGKPRR